MTSSIRVMIKQLLRFLIIWVPTTRARVMLLRWSGCRIGKDSTVRQGFIIVDEPADWEMIIIGERVNIAPRVTLVVSSRPTTSRIGPHAPTRYGPVILEDDVWLGTGVVVLPDVTIGEGAIVGSNSVVTKDVAPYTIVAGAPARFIRKLTVPWREAESAE